MMTNAGRTLALTRSKTTLDYFEKLLLELNNFEINKFRLKHLKLDEHEEIVLVVPENCQKCKGNYLISISQETGIKCDKLVATYSCNNCKDEYRIAFCLPVIIKKE